MFFTMGTKVLPGELPPRGRSIQAGSLCYINGCAVELVARLDASSAPPARRNGVLQSGAQGLCLASFGPGDVRHRLDAYATLTPGVCTRELKGLCVVRSIDSVRWYLR